VSAWEFLPSEAADGSSALKELENRHISIHCPYCEAFEEDWKECLEIGLDAYTTKPIKVKLLGIIEQFV